MLVDRHFGGVRHADEQATTDDTNMRTSQRSSIYTFIRIVLCVLSGESFGTERQKCSTSIPSPVDHLRADDPSAVCRGSNSKLSMLGWRGGGCRKHPGKAQARQASGCRLPLQMCSSVHALHHVFILQKRSFKTARSNRQHLRYHRPNTHSQAGNMCFERDGRFKLVC